MVSDVSAVVLPTGMTQLQKFLSFRRGHHLYRVAVGDYQSMQSVELVLI